MKSSLIIPCYNEAKNIPLLLDRCRPLLSSGVEVVIVDNGSSDESAQVLASLLPEFPGCTVVRVPVNQGYGYGILQGLEAAGGDVLGWTHADLQTDPQDFLTGLKYFTKNDTCVFVKGSRFGRPFADTVFTIGMSAFETLLLRKSLWDINAQPTIFPRVFFESWSQAPHDFSLDLFAYYHAKLSRLKLKRFPVFFGKRAHGVSHWNVNWAAKRKFIKRTVEFSLQLKRKIKNGNHLSSP